MFRPFKFKEPVVIQKPLSLDCVVDIVDMIWYIYQVSSNIILLNRIWILTNPLWNSLDVFPMITSTSMSRFRSIVVARRIIALSRNVSMIVFASECGSEDLTWKAKHLAPTQLAPSCTPHSEWLRPNGTGANVIDWCLPYMRLIRSGCDSLLKFDQNVNITWWQYETYENQITKKLTANKNVAERFNT